MFQSARIKLTIWYLAIIMLISLAFSEVLYQISIRELLRFEKMQRIRIETDLRIKPEINNGVAFPPRAPIRIDDTLIEDTRNRLILFLAEINTLILILSGVAAYFLAGKTLKPIKLMVEDQNRFISDASHELKTPLTAIKSSLEVFLRDNKVTLEEAKSLMKDNITDVDKLNSLTDSLLKFNRYENFKDSVELVSVNISKVIAESVRTVEPLAKDKNIKIIKIINNTTDNTIKGDEVSLSELFVILLDNAIKYSPEGKTVFITSRIKDKHLIVSVKDEGIGIKEEDRKNIFNRFYRADKARTNSDKNGYGLGLSIAKRIVEMNKGKINVVSEPGKGSTFEVCFAYV